MKKKLSIAVAFILCALSSNCIAQTVTAKNQSSKKEIKKQERAIRKSEVGTHVSQQFTADFPNATNITSSRKGTLSLFVFSQNGQQSKAYYDMDDVLIGMTLSKQISDLPIDAVKNIGKYFSGYNISKVIFFDDNEANETDMFLYGRQFEDADSYFVELSRGGKIIILQVTLNGEVFFFQSL